MIAEENKKFFKIGQIKKIKKDLNVIFTSFYSFLSLNITFIFFKITQYYIPFKVKIKKNKNKDYEIIFEDITNYELNLLKCKDVFIEKKDMNKITLQSNAALCKNITLNIIDYTVTNSNDPVFTGKIIDIIQNKQQDIIKIKYHDSEILIPYVQQFIIKCDNRSKKIVMNMPQGLY